jgi:nitroreductase
MDIDEAIRNRRSVRKYSSKQVEKNIIEKIIEAGQWAPTACNFQGYRFIVIDNPELFARITRRGAADFLKDVKQAILVLYDNQTDNFEYKDYIQSASAAIQNMLLKAHALQVGTCWINHLPRKQYLRKLLRIPAYYEPIALIALGYYDKEPSAVPRKKILSQIICYNTFSFDDNHEKKNIILLSIKIIARKIYLYLSVFPFLRKLAGKFEKKFDN